MRKWGGRERGRMGHREMGHVGGGAGTFNV